MKKKNYFVGIVLFVIAILFVTTSCAHTSEATEFAGRTYGFWWGLWNGMTIFFSFIGSLFNKTIVMYACDHTYGYDFGFWLGATGLSFFLKLLSPSNK